MSRCRAQAHSSSTVYHASAADGGRHVSACDAAHGYFERGGTLHISEAVLQAWGAHHPLLAQMAEAHTRGDHPTVLHAVTAFHRQHGGDGARLLSAAGAAAMRAGGASITQAPGTQPGVNCALYALGEWMGFSAAQSSGGSGGHAVHPGRAHVEAAETLLKVRDVCRCVTCRCVTCR